MITVCYYMPINEPELNLAEWLLAIGTIVLAGATIYLVIEARNQLKKVTEFINNYNCAVQKDLTFSQVQSLENIILKQIDFHYNIIDRIKNCIPLEKDVFYFLYEKRLRTLFILDNEIYSDDINGIIEKMNFAYSKLYEAYGFLLGHYFRNLYRIIKKINESSIDGFDNNHYAKLVRSQLSEYEILLLFYNCIWIEDGFKFKALIEKYQLLEGINFEKMLDNHTHPNSNIYNNEAYGER